MPATLEPPAAPEAAQAPAADKAAPKTAAKPDNNDVRARIDQFMVFSAPKKTSKPKEEKKPAEPEPEKKEPPKEEKAKAAEPEPAKKPEPEVKPEPKREPMTAREVAATVAETVDQVLTKREKPQPKTEEPKSTLPAEEQERQQNLAMLEQMYPKEYAGIASDRTKFLDSLRKYEEKWAVDHPGEEFNPDDSEHDGFYEKDPMNRVENEHLAKVIAKQIVADERKSLEERLNQIERASKVNPVAARDSAMAGVRVASEVGGKELSKIVNRDGTINDEVLNEMLVKEPEKAQVVADAAYTAMSRTSEIVKVFNEATVFTPRTNQTHAGIEHVWLKAERGLSRLTSEEWAKIDAGKNRPLENFVPHNIFYGLKEDGKTPILSEEQRAGKWSLNGEDLKELVAEDAVEEANKIIKNTDAIVTEGAKRRGYAIPSAKKPPQEETDKKAEEETPAETEQRSPSSTTEPKMDGVKGVSKSDAEKRGEALWRGMWGR